MFAHDAVTFVHALASLAEQSATNFVNNIVEPFAGRAKHYFYARLRLYSTYTDEPMDWPTSIEQDAVVLEIVHDVVNSTPQIPQPVTPASLTEHREQYLTFSYTALQVIEQYNEVQYYAAHEVHTVATTRWAYNAIAENNELMDTGKSKRRGIAKAILNCVNEDAIFTVDDLSDSVIAYINERSNTARMQIQHSRLYLSEGRAATSIQLKDCFRPPIDTVSDTLRSFAIVPKYTFSRKYVSINFRTLQALLRSAGATQTIMLARGNGEILNWHQTATNQFQTVFNFRKIGHGNLERKQGTLFIN